MAKRVTLPNDREERIMMLLVGGEKYGREIRGLYEKRTKESMPYGSLYTTLDRMEDKGFIESRDGEAGGDRGESRKKYYKVTAEGMLALNALRLMAGGAPAKGQVAQ